LSGNVLNGRIRGFAEGEGVARIRYHTARDGHNDPSAVAFDRNRMIRTWKLDLLFVHVFNLLLNATSDGGGFERHVCSLTVRRAFRPGIILPSCRRRLRMTLQ